MRRPASLLAIPLLGLALLAGCGTGDESGIDPTGDSSQSATESSEYLEEGGPEAGSPTEVGDGQKERRPGGESGTSKGNSGTGVDD